MISVKKALLLFCAVQILHFFVPGLSELSNCICTVAAVRWETGLVNQI